MKKDRVRADSTVSLRFLTAMMSVSLVVHIVLFWSFSSVPMFQRHIVPDLTFENLSEPPSRVIPRPRSVAKEPVDMDEVKDIRNFKASRAAVPPPVSATPAPAGKGSYGLGFVAGMNSSATAGEATLSVPSVPGIPLGKPGMHISQWNPGGMGDIGTSDFSSSSTYLEIVKLRIEKHKKYPEAAKRNHHEGSVGLRFVITLDGGIKDVEVVKSSQNSSLDQAALQALEKAAPFPKPPARFFKEEVSLQISIIFELT
jgi:periplasmic protein TonB